MCIRALQHPSYNCADKSLPHFFYFVTKQCKNNSNVTRFKFSGQFSLQGSIGSIMSFVMVLFLLGDRPSTLSKNQVSKTFSPHSDSSNYVNSFRVALYIISSLQTIATSVCGTATSHVSPSDTPITNSPPLPPWPPQPSWPLLPSLP